MSKKDKMGFVWLGALGLSLTLMLQAPVAWGQATDLVCSGCVQGTDIQNGTIGPNKLIPGSINATTIANGVIGPNKLIPGSINTATIANNAIRSNKILDGAVQSVDIQDGGVTAADIAAGAVGGSEVAINSLSDIHLTDEAGVEFVDGVLDVELTDAVQTVRTITLTAPTSGFIIANTTGTVFFGTTGPDGFTCSIANGPPSASDPLILADEGTSDIDFMPISGSRVFATAGGSVTIDLLCDAFRGAGNIFDVSLNAIFVPTRY